MRFLRLGFSTAVACLCAAGSLASEADDLRALKDQVAAERAALAKEREALQEQRVRVDAALRKLEEAQAPPEVIARVVPQPGPRLEVYGYAMMDATYDFNRSDPQWKAALRPSKIPVNCPSDPGCGEEGETNLSARQSRFGVKGFIPTPMGEVKTRFEFDMYGVGGDAGETTIRLRHAYGEFGPILAGQTNSLFMDGDVFPNTVEYWGPIGMVFFRNVQLRYTLIHSENSNFAFAIEHPGSAIDAGKVSQVDPSFGAQFGSWNQFPDFTAQYRFGGDWGHLQAAGILRSLGVQGPGGFDEKELGWGINLSGALNLFKKDQLMAQVVYGEGISNYMNDGGTDLAPSQTPPGAHAEAVSTLGWLLYYNRTWSDHFTSSFGFSENRQDTIAGQTGDAFEVGQYASANLLYQPVPDFFIGPEYIWGRRENRNGNDATDNRLQVSAKYNFGGTIGGDAR